MAETKKAPDYSQSAENLCNPEGVKELLDKLHGEQQNLNVLNARLKATNSELMELIFNTEQVIGFCQTEIRKAVEAQGSYQDIEAGDYAVKYRRMHKDYHVEPFKQFYPKYVSAVVEETINVKALEGLIKGGLISEDNLKHPEVGVITEAPQFAFFIR